MFLIKDYYKHQAAALPPRAQIYTLYAP